MSPQTHFPLQLQPLLRNLQEDSELDRCSRRQGPFAVTEPPDGVRESVPPATGPPDIARDPVDGGARRGTGAAAAGSVGGGPRTPVPDPAPVATGLPGPRGRFGAVGARLGATAPGVPPPGGAPGASGGRPPRTARALPPPGGRPGAVGGRSGTVSGSSVREEHGKPGVSVSPTNLDFAVGDPSLSRRSTGSTARNPAENRPQEHGRLGLGKVLRHAGDDLHRQRTWRADRSGLGRYL